MKTINPSVSIIAEPYAHALFDYSIKNTLIGTITKDLLNLYEIFYTDSKVIDYLLNPIINSDEKKYFIINLLESKINRGIFNLLMVLLKGNRVYLLEAVIYKYLKLIQKKTSVKTIEVIVAPNLTITQAKNLMRKVKTLTIAKKFLIVIYENPDLIGGILIKIESKVIDFTIKKQLQELAGHLNTKLIF